MLRILFLCVLASFLISCNEKYTMNEIDVMVSNIDTTNIDLLKGKVIEYRGIELGGVYSLYMMGGINNNCSPYIIEYNNLTHEISDISDKLVVSDCNINYLRKEEIIAAFKVFDSFKVPNISVDSFGNVKVVLFHDNRKTILYKITSPEVIEKKYSELSKQNWYIKGFD